MIPEALGLILMLHSGEQAHGSVTSLEELGLCKGQQTQMCLQRRQETGRQVGGTQGKYIALDKRERTLSNKRNKRNIYYKRNVY